jgi:hypothetical protein
MAAMFETRPCGLRWGQDSTILPERVASDACFVPREFREERPSVAKRRAGTPFPRGEVLEADLSAFLLLHFDKEQNENRPNSNRHGKLRRLRLLQRTSPRNGKRKAEHCHRREYSEDQFAFPVHGCFPSSSWLAHPARAILA